MIDFKNRLKKKLVFAGLFFLVSGAFLGVFLSNSMGMFYNFIIMPLVGAMGFFTLKRRWNLTLFGVFFLSFIWLFLSNFFELHQFSRGSLYMPLFFSTIYSVLTFFGAVIGMLLHYAFKKE